MATSTMQVTITENKTDVFNVDVLNENYFYKPMVYIIYGKDNKMVRRGQFMAPSVQLRTSYMQEGDYLFQILLNENETVNIPFHKTYTMTA
jgi:ABC-type uncharacterized transport system substrate-binding protein